MLIRPFIPSDFDSLYAVEELCFQPPLRFTRTYMRRIIQNPNAATWIADESSNLVGFAVVEWTPNESEIAAYIQTIEVAPLFRRKGIAAVLLLRAESSAQAAAARSIWLHVDVGNAAALYLYETRGYENQGREENYYARNRAAFVFAKSLA